MRPLLLLTPLLLQLDNKPATPPSKPTEDHQFYFFGNVNLTVVDLSG
jgi:hypothetical protein